MKTPQVITLCLYGASLGLSLAKHGKPREGTESFWISLFATVMQLGLLWWGGFFG